MSVAVAPSLPSVAKDGLPVYLPAEYCSKVAALPISDALKLELNVPISVTKKLIPALTHPCSNAVPPKTLRGFATLQELANWINCGEGSVDILARDYKGIGPAGKACLQNVLSRLGLLSNVQVIDAHQTHQGWEGILDVSGFGPPSALLLEMSTVVPSHCTTTLWLTDQNSSPILMEITSPAGILRLRDFSRVPR